MKIVVTGTSGFLGGSLVVQAREQGIDVISLDIIPSEGLDCIQADIRSSALVDVFPDRVDAIIHLAALSKDVYCRDNAAECFSVNVMGTLNLVHTAKLKNVKQFVFASSQAVYGDTRTDVLQTESAEINVFNCQSEYALSKIVSEVNLRQIYQAGFCDTTIVRPGTVYGTRDSGWSAVESISNDVMSKNEVRVGSLQTGRDFIHVTDVVSGILKTIGLPGFTVMNLTDDRLITLGEIINTASALTGRTPSVVEETPGEVSIRHSDNSRAREILQWQPKISLTQGVKSFLGRGN